MHIAIDAHMVGEQETGNETYIVNLTRALLDLTNRDPKGFSWDPVGPANATQTLSSTRRAQQRRFGSMPRFFLLSTHPDRLHAALPELADCPNAQVITVRPEAAVLRIPIGLPWAALRHSFDLLHVTYNAPPLSLCRTVVTIHDISFEHFPQLFSLRDRLILKTLVPLSARRAARVITGSQHAKQEIVDRYHLPPEKITVAYDAAGDQFQPIVDPASLQAVRAKYGIGDGPLVLAVGNLQPRKNLARLVTAFAQVIGAAPSPNHPIPPGRFPVTQSPSPPCLVIAGKAQWRESEVYQAVTQAGIERQVIFPGYVDDADLPALYSAATVFVYPSLYEGFGLPPLEAMACGTPVISSNAASLPEVVGDAALLVEPADTAGLAQALSRVLGDPGLRSHLSRSGLQRASLFSWTRCARETLQVYAQACTDKASA